MNAVEDRTTRGMVAGLENPHPLARHVPAVYQDDDFTRRFTQAFDAVLAPIFCSLDNLGTYLDPLLTPDDFLAWLAGWVGLVLDEDWPLERRRALVAGAVTLYRRRGTLNGLAEHIRLVTGARPELVESGGTSWSLTPESTLPGEPVARLTVTVRREDIADLGVVEALVASAKPAHVVATFEAADE